MRHWARATSGFTPKPRDSVACPVGVCDAEVGGHCVNFPFEPKAGALLAAKQGLDGAAGLLTPSKG
jgi:hypothetical protein